MSTLPPSCDDARERILTSLDGKGDKPLTHLEHCPDCRAYAGEMADILGHLRAIESEPLPDGLTDRIMDRVAQEEAAPKVVPLARRLLSRKYASIAAATLLVALAVPLMLRPGVPGTSQQVARAPRQVEQTSPSAKTAPVKAEKKPSTDSATEAVPSVAAKTAEQSSTSVTAALPADATVSHTKKPIATPKKATPVRKVPARSVRATAIAQAPAQTTQATDAAEQMLASALPQEAFAAEQEGDVYYDPLSEFVGF